MLVGQQGEIVLSDFDIAAIAHNTTSRTAQEALGTIPYMGSRVKSRLRLVLPVINMRWGWWSMNGSVENVPLKGLLLRFLPSI
jgi:hypothetical protein